MKLSTPKALAACVAAFLMFGGGCAAEKPGRREMARAEWNAARARVLLNLAQDQFDHGNAVDARKTADDALAISPEVGGVHVLRAKLDIEAGDLRGASASLAAAAVLAPGDAEVDYLAGMVAERWQRPDEALYRYRAAWQKDDAELAHLLSLGEALVAVGRFDEAAALLEGRLRYFEGEAVPLDLLGQVYQQQGRFADAAETFRRAAVLAGSDDADLRSKRARALALAGEPRQAAALLERLSAEPGAEPSLDLALAECRMRTGEPAAARAAFGRAARADEANVTAWLGLAKSSLALGDFDRSELALARAAALRPAGRDAGDLALLRGYLRLKQGRVGEAGEDFALAARLDPADATAAAMLGHCRRALGDAAAADAALRRAVALDPNDPIAAELMRPLAGVDVSPAAP